ncbi:LppU/SCO3897 family protein [Rugosimonospora africana]|uniref:Uncharacterized protein n=1 Tax=Rugosimonospora africana TaxID=556532 RepID=A0A8J3QUM1_9ACTN|nr:hypothetical protein [Rugosimonospora africana]GIH16801.1 hypothetical protein Raf01_49730 [Rugosimonospora africana]
MSTYGSPQDGGQNPYHNPGPPGYPPMATPPMAAPPEKRNRKPLIIGIVIGVLVLCCGGGTVAALVNKSDTSSQAGGTSADSSPSQGDAAKPSPTDETIHGDLDKLNKGDCLVYYGSLVVKASCDTKGALKVLLKVKGTTSEDACADTDYTETLYEDDPLVNSEDFVLCVESLS